MTIDVNEVLSVDGQLNETKVENKLCANLKNAKHSNNGTKVGDKKFVEEITPRDKDFAQWYTDVVKKAELADYSRVRGCMIIRPHGYSIWEGIQRELDQRFKQTGHENISMPMLIPESLLQKEKDHVEGFAPEVAWVTHGGSEPLAEKLCIRPTSETLFCDHFADIVKSYRDLPKLYNQWCSVVRWEKTSRPFLRSVEFLWQEGHTIHATAEEAKEETLKMLDIYSEVCEKVLAIPVIKGRKTDKEKFAGAEETYTIEAQMHDGKALQSGTSHYFGDGFAKAFNIRYLDKDGRLKHPYQTSWGMSTRTIGALIMVHGDDNGLVLPPAIASTQLVIIPIAHNKGGVLEKANEIKAKLSKVARVKIDDSNNKTPGWKFSEYEMKGIPVRLEIGPKDIEKDQVVLVRRDNREKIFVPINELETRIPEILDNIQQSLFEKAKESRDKRIYTAQTFEQFENLVKTQPGFIKTMWCGDRKCEETIKEKTGATSRCIPFEQEKVGDTCVCCGKPADSMVYWGTAY